MGAPAMILFGREILIRRGMAIAIPLPATTVRAPGAPSWNLYHPVTSRLDDVIADLDSAKEATNVGANWEWVREKLERIEGQVSTFPRVRPDAEERLSEMIQKKFDDIDLAFWYHADPDLRESFRRWWLRYHVSPPLGAMRT